MFLLPLPCIFSLFNFHEYLKVTSPFSLLSLPSSCLWFLFHFLLPLLSLPSSSSFTSFFFLFHFLLLPLSLPSSSPFTSFSFAFLFPFLLFCFSISLLFFSSAFLFPFLLFCFSISLWFVKLCCYRRWNFHQITIINCMCWFLPSRSRFFPSYLPTPGT